MQDKPSKKQLIFLFLLATCLLGLTYFGLYSDTDELVFGVAVVPLGLIMVYLFVFHLKALFFLMVLSLPLSLNMRDVGGGIGISLPSEVMIAFLAVGVLSKMILQFEVYRKYFFHPVSMLVVAHVAWIAVTCLTSSMFIVSLKFLIVRTSFILVFFFYAIELLQEQKDVRRFFYLYFIGFVPVIVYSFVVHSAYGFTQQTSNRICYPFYNDHTIYAAVMAMLIPVFVAIHVVKKRLGAFDSRSVSNITVLVVLIFSIFMSYSRAGVVSLMVAVVGWVVFRFKVPFWRIVSVLLICTIVGVVLKGPIGNALSSNDTVSGGSVVENLKSTSNISSDASNTERINRWKCAIRMFQERPVFGYGPGTYMFNYGAFQQSDDKTEISVEDGSLGGAHSEYLKPLSESGLLGIVFFIGAMLATIFYGMRVIYTSKSTFYKYMAMGIVLGFSTYVFHGIVNFFLDTDKFAVLFLGFMALITVFDVKNQEDLEAEEEK